MENQLYHHGVKGMKWGVRRKKDSISDKEIRSDRERKRRELETKYSKQSKGDKYYNEAIKILEKYDLDGDDGGGGKSNTPDSARLKYMELLEKSQRAYESDRVFERANVEAGQYIVEKYGQQRIDKFNQAEAIKGAAITAGVLVACGTVTIGAPILANKAANAVGRGIVKGVKKAMGK